MRLQDNYVLGLEIEETSRDPGFKQKPFPLHFSTWRDAEGVLQSGPWNFDCNLLIIEKISGVEQSSELELHVISF